MRCARVQLKTTISRNHQCEAFSSQWNFSCRYLIVHYSKDKSIFIISWRTLATKRGLERGSIKRSSELQGERTSLVLAASQSVQ